MTYLQLCNKTRNLAGIAGPNITDVTNTSDQIDFLITEWIKDAWLEIQTDPNLAGAFVYNSNHTITLLTQTATNLYEASDFGLDDDISFVYERFFIENNDTWLKLYKEELNQVNINVDVGTPSSVVPLTQNSFYLLPTNKEQCNLKVDYLGVPQELTNNSDTPNVIQAVDQLLIVYKALLTYAYYDDAPELIQFAERQYKETLNKVFRKYTIMSRPTQGQPVVIGGNF